MSRKPTSRRIEKQAHLRWVKLGQMRINPLAQRELNAARVDKLCAEFEEERLGYPVLNYRGGWFYVIDGQHRRAALIKWLDADDANEFEWQCYVYDGENSLTPEEEAEVFLKLNDTLTVTTFDKFTKGIQAGRTEETDIDRIVRALNLRISKAKGDGAIGAVASLRKVYRLGTLARSLRIIRDAYGDAGFGAPVIEGVGLLCQRYNGELDEARTVERLSRIHGGVDGLMNAAGKLRRETGLARAHCVAAAAVDIYNRGRGGQKLPSWWRAEE